jgi:hypothetical protein
MKTLGILVTLMFLAVTIPGTSACTPPAEPCSSGCCTR